MRECAVSLCEPLTFIFNCSLRAGLFPDIWKHSFISPIFKSGNSTDVKNYRPVCIQSAIPKVFEKVILPVLDRAFAGTIVEQQHGFVEGRSTVTNLYVYTNYIGEAMDKGYEVHSVYTDFSKAFDLLDQDILLDKLESFGIVGSLHSWLASYLKGRTLQVRLQGFLSERFNVASGVPQGSHLGPKLFLLLVNDIGKDLSSNFLLFADDLKIFRCIESSADCALLQGDLTLLHEWCLKNNLKLNVGKCSYMIFGRKKNEIDYRYSIGGSVLGRVEVMKDLGICLDSMLRFTDHYDQMISKANQMLGFIMRMSKDFKDLHCMVMLYISYVRSLLEYGSIIWCPHYDIYINRIEAVQEKFLRYMRYRMPQRGLQLSMEELMSCFGLGSLRDRRGYMDLCFFFKIVNNVIVSPEILKSINFHVPPRILRRSPLLSYSGFSTRHYHNMSYNRIVSLVNSRPDLNFFGNSLNSFKYKLRSAIS